MVYTLYIDGNRESAHSTLKGARGEAKSRLKILSWHASLFEIKSERGEIVAVSYPGESLLTTRRKP